MAEASDEAILRLGQREGRIVVTLDADFHMLLAVSGASRPSVIRIRDASTTTFTPARWGAAFAGTWRTRPAHSRLGGSFQQS